MALTPSPLIAAGFGFYMERDTFGLPFLQAEASRLFFERVCRAVPPYHGAFVIVTHALPTVLPFLTAISTLGEVVAVIPKPRSIDLATLDAIASRHHVIRADRTALQSTEFIDATIAPLVGGRKLILLDVGGYFAQNLGYLRGLLGERLLGVVEDTENGHQKYSKISAHNTRVMSVARSLSKRYEDRWVGQAIIFSAETLLRTGGTTLIGKRAYVLGFGKIGQSVAHNLKNRGVNVTIWDTNSHQRLYARCKDFLVAPKNEALRTSDLIFCATGNRALEGADYSHIRDGAVVFSVTSSDDELDLSPLRLYKSKVAGFALTRYTRDGQSFLLANDGNAVNFLHGAEVRPYIHLVQAALLMGVARLVEGKVQTGKIHSPTSEEEMLIADVFEQCFFPA